MSVCDLEGWAGRVQSSADRLMENFADRYGYPPDSNTVTAGAGTGGALIRSGLEGSAQVPPSIIEFFDAIEEVSLPDVWNGYFLGPPTRVLAIYTQQQPRWLEVRGQLIEILVIGSDGGGALYVVPLDDSGSVYRIEDAAITDGVLRAGREQQTRRVSADFSAFLCLFAEEVEAFVEGRSVPTF